jgi:hypothetical protein
MISINLDLASDLYRPGLVSEMGDPAPPMPDFDGQSVNPLLGLEQGFIVIGCVYLMHPDKMALLPITYTR